MADAHSIDLPIADVKKCSRCGEEKSFSEYRKKLGKLTSACVSCLSVADKAYRDGRSPEKRAAQNARKRAYDKANPEIKRRGNKAYIERHPERFKESQRKWYQKNKEYFAEKSKRWAEANPSAYRAMMRKAESKMRENNDLFALKKRIRARIGLAFRQNGYTKRSQTQRILGCDWEFFKAHIERQFSRGMSWDRMDEIHLDHIVPLATAKTEEDVMRLNHFTNIRPLWAKENAAKRDKIDFLI